MRRYIPNLITLARLGLTLVFFACLNVHQSDTFARAMWLSLVIFVIASATDVLDGYLARHWKVESAFGRVVDPFVDKILICGAFVFFSSTHFLDPAELARLHSDPEAKLYTGATAVTGVAPWMTVLILAREFLVTSIRGLAESRGIQFGADWAGKLKMVVQSVTIGAIIVDVAVAFQNDGHHTLWIMLTRNLLIWATLATTLLSCLGYLARSRRILDPLPSESSAP